MAKCDLPKVELRVRFPLPAPVCADVAQLVEQYFRKVEVGGSNPLIGSIYDQSILQIDFGDVAGLAVIGGLLPF